MAEEFIPGKTAFKPKVPPSPFESLQREVESTAPRISPEAPQEELFAAQREAIRRGPGAYQSFLAVNPQAPGTRSAPITPFNLGRPLTMQQKSRIVERRRTQLQEQAGGEATPERQQGLADLGRRLLRGGVEPEILEPEIWEALAASRSEAVAPTTKQVAQPDQANDIPIDELEQAAIAQGPAVHAQFLMTAGRFAPEDEANFVSSEATVQTLTPDPFVIGGGGVFRQ